MKPYYDDGKGIVIYHGDCREILPALPKVDLVLTDPPYGTGHHTRSNGVLEKKKFDWDVWDVDFLFWCSFPIVMFIPPDQLLGKNWDGWRLLAWVSENPLKLKNVAPRYGIQPIIARGRFPDEPSLDWFKFRNNIQTLNHPHEKPIEVMKWLVSSLSYNGTTVVDPFMGSGTTLRAAKDLGRKAIGIEIEERYCEIAARRLAQEVFEFA